MLVKYVNNPAHLFLDNTPYFITAIIYQKRHLLAKDDVKYYLLSVIKESFANKGWILNDWVILNNHYHLLVVSNKGKDLSKIMSRIHMLSAQFICKELNAEKPIWWNYWDYCPRNERDYFVHLNYLFNNPVKHGYVANLLDYPFSSFSQLLEMQGRDNLVNQFRGYSEYKCLQLVEDDF